MEKKNCNFSYHKTTDVTYAVYSLTSEALLNHTSWMNNNAHTRLIGVNNARGIEIFYSY